MHSILSTIRGAIDLDASKINEQQSLTSKEKKTLQNHWPMMMECNPELFKKAWIRSAQRSTSIKKAFGMEENEDPEKNEQFMKLPLTIENFFKELIIDCECDERKIRPKCEQLGARHIDFSGRGFHSNFWDIFLVCMMEVIGECSMKCSENQKRVCVLAWNRLLNAVVKDMRAGYDNRRRSIGHRKSKQDE